jgi:hypothetical protein
VSRSIRQKIIALKEGLLLMKNIVRAFAVVLAVAGATAGVVSSHATRAEQVATLGHQVVLSAMPAPACSPASCNIRGGN